MTYCLFLLGSWMMRFFVFCEERRLMDLLLDRIYFLLLLLFLPILLWIDERSLTDSWLWLKVEMIEFYRQLISIDTPHGNLNITRHFRIRLLWQAHNVSLSCDRPHLNISTAPSTYSTQRHRQLLTQHKTLWQLNLNIDSSIHTVE